MKTHAEICEKKRMFMRLLEITEDPKQKEVYAEAVKVCDRRTARIAKLIVLLIGLALGTSGCGKMLQGTGLIIEGLGDATIAAGEHLQESSTNN